jgi:hypothetical protein
MSTLGRATLFYQDANKFQLAFLHPTKVLRQWSITNANANAKSNTNWQPSFLSQYDRRWKMISDEAGSPSSQAQALVFELL